MKSQQISCLSVADRAHGGSMGIRRKMEPFFAGDGNLHESRIQEEKGNRRRTKELQQKS